MDTIDDEKSTYFWEFSAAVPFRARAATVQVNVSALLNLKCFLYDVHRLKVVRYWVQSCINVCISKQIWILSQISQMAFGLDWKKWPHFQNGWPKHTPSSILRVLTYEILESYWCKIFDKLHVWFQNSYNFNQYLAHRLSFQSYGSCSLSGTLDLLQFSHNTLDICIQTIPTPRHITVWHNVSLSMVGGDS